MRTDRNHQRGALSDFDDFYLLSKPAPHASNTGQDKPDLLQIVVSDRPGDRAR